MNFNADAIQCQSEVMQSEMVQHGPPVLALLTNKQHLGVQDFNQEFSKTYFLSRYNLRGAAE